MSNYSKLHLGVNQVFLRAFFKIVFHFISFILFLFTAYVFQNVSQADEEFKSLPEVGKYSSLLIGQINK